MARHHAEVVRDQQHRHAQLVLEAVEKLEDLRLYGHVERRRRLVRNQHLGVTDERHRDHDALPHATGELMGIMVDALVGVGDADQAQHLDGARAGGGTRHVLMDNGRFGDLIPDREDGVQRRHRLLEDHGDLVAADRPQLGRREGEEIAALEFDQAAGKDVAGRLRHETENRERRDGLAAPRFADNAQGLAGVEIERDVVHGPRRALAVLGDEVRLEVADAQQRWRKPARVRIGHAASSRGSSASRTPSATAFNDITTREIASPGKSVDHGAL